MVVLLDYGDKVDWNCMQALKYKSKLIIAYKSRCKFEILFDLYNLVNKHLKIINETIKQGSEITCKPSLHVLKMGVPPCQRPFRYANSF